MSADATPTKNKAQSFLAEDEELQLNWEGILKKGEDEKYPAEFAVTNSRLVFSLGGGHFKDISFQHIESVEVATDIETVTDGTDPDGILGMSSVSAIVGVGAMILGGFSAISVLFGLALLGVGAYGLWYGKTNYDRLKEDLDVTEHEVYHILLRTSATSPFSVPIYIETKENVGPDLSRLVQESK